MSDNLPPLPEHWFPLGFMGTNASFQRAAREYAEEYASAALAQAQSCVPAGYVLISVDALKAWGKFDLVNESCSYATATAPQPVAQPGEPNGWATDWLCPDGTTKPVYSPGSHKPNYGAELNALLNSYPVYATTLTQAKPEQAAQPMNIEEIDAALQEHKRIDLGNIDPARGVFILGVVAAERHHGIAAPQPKD